MVSKFFNMGIVVVTRGIDSAMREDIETRGNNRFAVEVNLCLQRFAVKDFGNLDEEDKQTNEEALQYPDDLYLFGAYQTCRGKIYIITERISEKPGVNATTVCFPYER